jgi:hypothetical protein
MGVIPRGVPIIISCNIPKINKVISGKVAGNNKYQ